MPCWFFLIRTRSKVWLWLREDAPGWRGKSATLRTSQKSMMIAFKIAGGVVANGGRLIASNGGGLANDERLIAKDGQHVVVNPVDGTKPEGVGWKGRFDRLQEIASLGIVEDVVAHPPAGEEFKRRSFWRCEPA